LLKYFKVFTDKTIKDSLLGVQIGGTFMGKKHDGHGQKKKLTKKEIKAMNHAKLMASKGGGQSTNVVDINAYRDQNKKAA
jgi:hypothetical protein